MASTASFLRASRPLFRQSAFSTQARQAFTRSQYQRPFQQQFRSQGGRRWQSTDAGAQQQSWFKRMWESEVGFKTVHFWAPVMKVRFPFFSPKSKQLENCAGFLKLGVSGDN
jgi:hypothetical protein